VLEIIRPGVLGKAKLVGFWGFQHELGLNPLFGRIAQRRAQAEFLSYGLLSGPALDDVCFVVLLPCFKGEKSSFEKSRRCSRIDPP
jgi:hypothetical protein